MRARKNNREDGINLVPLHIAAAIGDIDAVKTRIQAGDIDFDEEENSSLIWAAVNGRMDIVKILFQALTKEEINKPKRLIEEAQAYLSHHPNTKSLSVIKGKLHEVSIPWVSDTFQVILPNEEDITSIKTLNKRVEDFNAVLEITVQAERLAKQFVMILNHDGIVRYLDHKDLFSSEYARKKIIKLLMLASENKDHYPVIITNKNNFDIIMSLIVMQCEAMNKSKTLIIQAIEAARRYNQPAIAEYLENQQDINEQDNDGNTLLYRAAQAGDIERVRELIQKGADVNVADPLYIAAAKSGGKSAGKRYISKEHTDIIKLLLEHKADPNQSAALAASVHAGNAEVVALLLPITTKKPLVRKKDSISEPYMDPWYVDMMFDALGKKEDIAILTLLKEYGADFNVKHKSGLTMLEHACGYGLDKLDFLLANGADPRKALAAFVHTYPINLTEEYVDRLLQHGADVNAVDDEGWTPLHVAARKGDYDLAAIDYLIKHGAVIDWQDTKKRTPLHHAVIFGHLEAIKLLLERGANPHLTDEKGLTPSDVAAEYVTSSKTDKFISQEGKEQIKNKYLVIQQTIAECIAKREADAAQKKPRGCLSNSIAKLTEYFGLYKVSKDQSLEYTNSMLKTDPRLPQQQVRGKQ